MGALPRIEDEDMPGNDVDLKTVWTIALAFLAVGLWAGRYEFQAENQAEHSETHEGLGHVEIRKMLATLNERTKGLNFRVTRVESSITELTIVMNVRELK